MFDSGEMMYYEDPKIKASIKKHKQTCAKGHAKRKKKHK